MNTNLRFVLSGLGLVLLLAGGQALAQDGFVNEDIPDEMLFGDGISGGVDVTGDWGWVEGLDLDHFPDNETLDTVTLEASGARFQVSQDVVPDPLVAWDIYINDDYPIDNGNSTEYLFDHWLIQYEANWTDYSAYQLAFTNNSTTDWVYVYGVYKPNWGSAPGGSGWRETPGTWVGPLETQVVTGHFETVTSGDDFSTVANFGFMLESGDGTVHPIAETFDVTVSATEIPKPSDVYVDDDWAGSTAGEPVGAGYVFGYDAFATIQDGLAGVEGSTINVANGTYSGPIVIDKGISIIGDSGVYVENTGTGNVFDINASGFDVVLDNMTIRNGDYGVYSAAGNVDVHDCTFTGNDVDLYLLADAGTSLANNNSFSGSTYGVQNADAGGQLDASCCWWGSLSGPSSDLNHGAGVAIAGDVLFIPWLDGPGGTCDQYPSTVNVSDALINATTGCVTLDVTLDRVGTTTARSISVEFTLSSELELCTGTPGGDIQLATGAGTWWEGFSPNFEVIDNGGSYTADIVILGGDCGPTAGGRLFTINLGTTLSEGNDGVGTVTVVDVRFRHCDNSPLACVPGTPGTVTVDLSLPPALAALGAVQDKTDNGADGTTFIDLSWADPGSGADQVEIWRKGYGDYPEYDTSPTFGAPVDAGGGWTPVTTVPVGDLGYPDEPSTRDFSYYAAYVIDVSGNYSASVTITSHGTLNYHLGDVSDGNPGVFDNTVDGADISLLGAHYGVSLNPGDTYNYLDVGPTTDYSVDALPTTDDVIEFEDMVMFAINFDEVSKTLTRPTPAAANEIALHVGEIGAVGSTFPVEVRMTGDGRIQGLSLPFTWDSGVVDPVAMQPGDFLQRHGGRHMVLSPEPGTVDAALFGVADLGICGEGHLATLTFKVKAPGDPQISFGDIRARDAKNREIGLEPIIDGDTPSAVPNRTVLNQAVPNPFNPSTKLSFVLASPGHARLKIYDTAGRLVDTLVDEYREPGPYEVTWEGKDSSGRVFAAGVYLYRLEVGSFSETKRMVLIK